MVDVADAGRERGPPQYALDSVEASLIIGVAAVRCCARIHHEADPLNGLLLSAAEPYADAEADVALGTRWT